jgi:predicted RNA-binding Zn-ribbon protein involved in translation (DUF1610 family)
VRRGHEIAFPCPACGAEAICGLEGSGECPRCGGKTELRLSASLREKGLVDQCPSCEGAQFYVQRDFNQKAGLAIVILGGLLAPFTPYYSSLVVAALADAALYAVLPEITICYRCHAHFRGFRRNPSHHRFDLHTAEQYTVRSQGR